MGCGASSASAYTVPEQATEQRAPVQPEPEPPLAKAEPPLAKENVGATQTDVGATSLKTDVGATKTDVGATKAKTRGALLGGLKSGALEAAVAKMEEDTAAEEEAAVDAPVRCTHCFTLDADHTLSFSLRVLPQSPTPRSELAAEVGDQLTEEGTAISTNGNSCIRQASRLTLFGVCVCAVRC